MLCSCQVQGIIPAGYARHNNIMPGQHDDHEKLKTHSVNGQQTHYNHSRSSSGILTHSQRFYKQFCNPPHPQLWYNCGPALVPTSHTGHISPMQRLARRHAIKDTATKHAQVTLSTCLLLTNGRQQKSQNCSRTPNSRTC